jgi:hypothetical protein
MPDALTEEAARHLVALQNLPLKDRLLSSSMLERQVPGAFWDFPGAVSIGIPLNDTSRNSTPEEVGELYASLYEKMARGQQEAHAAGKRFAVILGESHTNRNSLGLTHMITMIAKDLGIEYRIDEMDGSGLVGQEHFTDRFNILPTENDTARIGKRFNNGTLINSAGIQRHVIAGDPQHAIAGDANDEIINDAELVFANRELGFIDEDGLHHPGMVDALREVGQDCVGVYGADHLQALLEHMPDDIRPLVFDITNKRTITNRSGREQPESDLDREVGARQEFRIDAAADGKIEHIVVPGRGVNTAENAWEMALDAREQFHAKHPEHERSPELDHIIEQNRIRTVEVVHARGAAVGKAVSAAGAPIGVALGAKGLYDKFSDENSAYHQDVAAGGVRAKLADVGVVADAGNVGIGVVDSAKGIATLAKGAKAAAADVAELAEGASGALGVLGEMAGTAALPVALVAGAADAGAAIVAKDGHRAAAAVGGTTGGLAGGIAGAEAGGETGAMIGTFIAPGVGTAIGAAVGGLVGGIGGALAFSSLTGKAADAAAGEWADKKLHDDHGVLASISNDLHSAISSIGSVFDRSGVSGGASADNTAARRIPNQKAGTGGPSLS